MIFERFRIHNLFSYYGSWEFDLTPPTDGRNLVLIWGRNGYGKTSFINSLKLLFAGVSDELREGIQRQGRRFGRNDYLVGQDDEWVGVFNLRARAAGETEFGVSLDWREAAGSVTVERIWRLERNEPIETLRVQPSFGAPLQDENGNPAGEARAFIQSRLPETIMPFFIYDGEKVQQIAEANREGQLHQIEQLLDLVDIDVLDEYLGRNLAQWRSASKDSTQHKINQLRHEIQAMEEQMADLDADHKALDDEIKETEYALKRLDVTLQARRQFALQSEVAKLDGKHEGVMADLEDRTQRFFDSFTRDAPLALNSLLMGNAARELEKIAAHPNRRLRDELERIFAAIPERLLSDPPLPVPPLNRGQEEFLRRKLGRILDSYRPDAADIQGGLFHLMPEKASALLQVVEDYANNDQLRTGWARDLVEIHRRKTELIDIDRKRNDVSNLDPEERRLFEERSKEREKLNTELGSFHQEIGRLAEKRILLNRQLEQKREECHQEEKKVAGANAARDRLSLGQKLKTALAAYRSLLKARRREDIEKAFNSRFKELMTSHSQIQRIQVKDDFSLHYLNIHEEPVGMGNISAGMKQLVAQALLWGLKDVSGKEAPVVVDTPLARIDRKHQENLITRYYPNAGPQVIVLPTDSEIDREKYALLQPHVYREYRLHNPYGDRTQVEMGGIY